MIQPEKIYRLRDFDDINEELDFLFNNYFKSRRPVLMPIERGWKPLTDVFETDEEIVVVMDIAGITTRDISLRLHQRVLSIRGIRRERSERGKRKYYKMEIDFGPFERQIELPAAVDPDEVRARYWQGFLEVRLPKRDTGIHERIEIKIT